MIYLQFILFIVTLILRDVSVRSFTSVSPTTSRVANRLSTLSSSTNDEEIGTVAILVPNSNDASKFGDKSPIQTPPTYIEVAQQLTNKIRHFSDGRITAKVVTPNSDNDDAHITTSSNMLIALGLTSPPDIQYLSQTFRKRRELQEQSSSTNYAQFAVDCGSNEYAPVVGPYDLANPSISSMAPWTSDASGKRLSVQMKELFEKHNTDEFALAIMLFFNQFSGEKVPWVQHSIDVTWEKGIFQNAKELYGMVSKCGNCITECLGDEDCAACINALDKIDTRDQVASYRTVVSYESELLRDFSLCILQKNNIFECSAEIPKLPVVEPMNKWNGNDMSVDIARGIMIGHLEGVGQASLEPCQNLDVSWKVACGANVAYDQFPSQNQLFYPSRNGKDLWYDPVFRVETIDGRNVWCKRHYRVRNGPVPGTFRFSVLDNGVTSDEFWTILGAADDLSWVCFHYAGAAGAVGQVRFGFELHIFCLYSV